MTQPPHDPRPEVAPALEDVPDVHRQHRTKVVALLLAVAGLLAVAFTLVTLSREPDDQRSQRPAGAATATDPGDGSALGAQSSADPDPSTSAPGKVYKLGDHPLLQDATAGLPNLVCELPAWTDDEAAATEFFRAATHCLDRAWGKLLREHDFPFTPPRLYFPGGKSFSSDCGTIKVGIATAAYYCEGELFLPFKGLQLDQYEDNPGVYLALIAHEYGHHVQELTGIMDAAWRKIYDYGETSPEGREMSRRKELQAQCFSGMFLGAHVDRGGSITREMYDEAWQDQETRGDDTSGGQRHGTNANYAHWWRIGALDNHISDCNTFKADTRSVR